MKCGDGNDGDDNHYYGDHFALMIKGCAYVMSERR